MKDYQLLIDLHKSANRQGPGGDAETEMAIDMSMIDRSAPLKIADIGCGTGASTLLLAQLLKAQITAVDFLQDFLEVLEGRAEKMGLSEKVSTRCCSMDNLPFGDEEFDVIWSEGAIYNIGFERGVKDWNRYLKVGGLLVVSEITWITDSRPSELQKYWDDEYPEIDMASSKVSVLEKNGYSPIGYFVLPEHCWLENYYRPMQNSFKDFLDRNGNSEEARAIVQAENREIKLYEKYKTHYSYGVYIARKLDEIKP
ncbi:methyltransferase domain-containing protein [bacterium]|nr:methyltransferase domain-containing protein [bacterium]RQV95521.1 MAG: class I SAM-dependent methyltransferase [bacterium]